jgi:hypothetical protein
VEFGWGGRGRAGAVGSTLVTRWPGVGGASERKMGRCWAKMADSWATRKGKKDLAGWARGQGLAQSEIKEGKPFFRISKLI